MSEGTGWMTLILGIVIVIALGMWGLPQYGVYHQRLAGEAELANAE